MEDKREEKAGDDSVVYPNILARIEVEKKWNLGAYESETIKVVLEGPFEMLKNGKDLPKMLLYVTYNSVKLLERVRERKREFDLKPAESLDPNKEVKQADITNITKEEIGKQTI